MGDDNKLVRIKAMIEFPACELRVRLKFSLGVNECMSQVHTNKQKGRFGQTFDSLLFAAISYGHSLCEYVYS